MNSTFLRALFCAMVLSVCATAAFAWKPTKEIEFVVPSAPGGGSDLNARTIADIAKQQNLSPSNIMVLNKPGGSGAVAFSYVGSKKGDNHVMMVLHSGQDLGSYVLNWDVKGADMTYLGTVAFDDLLLCVTADAKVKDIKELIELSKKERITYGGSQKGNGDHLSFLMTNKFTGSQFKYVMFNSSGEVTSAMLGGHVNIGVFNPSEAIGQIRAGKMIPLAMFSEQRLGEDFAKVPTFKELGFKDLVLSEVRAISGPPAMSPEAVAFYETMLEQVTKTEAWQKNYIEKNFLTPVFKNAAQTREFFLRESQAAMARFKEDGLVK